MPNPNGGGNNSGATTRRRSGGGASGVDDDDDAGALNSSITSSSHNNRSIYMGVSADSVHSPPGGPETFSGTPLFLGATHRFLLAGSVPFAGSAPDPSLLAISPPDGSASQTDVVAAFLAAQTNRVSPASAASWTGTDAPPQQQREETSSTIGETTPPSANAQQPQQQQSSPGTKRATILVPSSFPPQQPQGPRRRTTSPESKPTGAAEVGSIPSLPPSVIESSSRPQQSPVTGDDAFNNRPPAAATEHVVRHQITSPRGLVFSASPPTPVVTYAPVTVTPHGVTVPSDDGSTTTSGVPGSRGGAVVGGGATVPETSPSPPSLAMESVGGMSRKKSDDLIGVDFRGVANASPSASGGYAGLSGAPSPTQYRGQQQHSSSGAGTTTTTLVRGQSPSRRLVTAGSASNRGGGGRGTPQHDAGAYPTWRPPSSTSSIDERNTTTARLGPVVPSPLQSQQSFGPGSGRGGAAPAQMWRSSSPAQQAPPVATNEQRRQTPLLNHEDTANHQSTPIQVMSPYHEYLRKQGLRRQDDGSHSYPVPYHSRTTPSVGDSSGSGVGGGGVAGHKKLSPHGSPYGSEDLAVAPMLRGGGGDPGGAGGALPRRRSVDDLKDLTDPVAWRSCSPGLGGGALRSANQTPSKWSDHNPHDNATHRQSNSNNPSTQHVRVPSGNLRSVPNSPPVSAGAGGGGKGNGGKPPTKERRAADRRRAAAVDEDEMLEKQRRNAATTSALHSIPWLQRHVETSTGFGGDKCVMCMAPKFWVRVDWTLRATFLAVLPATILSLDPSTTGYFSQPSTVASFAFWITAPTFGAGLREFAIVIKGSLISVVLLWIVITINPVNHVLFVVLYFVQILLLALVAESVKKTGAWCISASMIQFYMDPVDTGYAFARDFFISVMIGGLMGIGAFLLPRINWADNLAVGSLTTYGSAVSIVLQGVVSSYWSKTEMEREFCLIRIRQLIDVTQECKATIKTRLAEAEYEPHSAWRLDRIQRRSTFLDEMTRIVACVLQLVENIAAKPEVCQSPLLKPFGERLAEPLGVLVSAMDNTVLKICDMKHPVTLGDIMLFQRVREDFQEHVSRIREELILNNDDYYTDEPDIFLGAFLFCIDELGETIESFREPAPGKSRLLEWAMSPSEDIKSGYYTVQFFLKMLLTGTLIRRAKEAIKLALSMTIPVMIQVFLLNPEDATPVAGPALIAFVYQRTGAESFQYASNRVLGTVIGSLTALISVQVADGKLWLMYIFLGILSLIGNFVQSSVPYSAAGNAVVFSVISVISQYSDSDAAMGRIQQNVFAILIYFVIAYTLWPVRAGEKLTLELDSAIRSYRETIYKLLGNMDSSMEDVQEAILGAEEHWKEYSKRIQSQGTLIPAALREPTLIGAAFPEQPWLRLIQSQQTLAHLAWMMRYAFNTFENNQSDASGDRSLHWVVVKHIAPEARECAELIFAACDLYLLALSHSEMVPIQHLVRLRISMVTIYRQMIKTYASALVIRLDDDKLMQMHDDDHLLAPNLARRETTRPPHDGSNHSRDDTSIGGSPRGGQQPVASNRGSNPAAANVPPRPPAFPDTPEQHMPSAGMTMAAASTRPHVEVAPLNVPGALAPLGSGDAHLPRPTPRLSPSQVAAEETTAASRGAPPLISLPASSVSRKVDSPVLSSAILEEVGHLNFSQTGDSNSNSVGPRLGAAQPRSAEPSEASDTNYVLRNRDIHSIEAFLFGIRASVMEIDEFQKALLAVQHAGYLGTKL